MTSRSRGEKWAEKRTVLGTAIFFAIATVIGRTIARGQPCMCIRYDLDRLCSYVSCWLMQGIVI